MNKILTEVTKMIAREIILDTVAAINERLVDTECVYNLLGNNLSL